MKLLISGTQILGTNPVESEDGSHFVANGVVFHKTTMPGYTTPDIDVPAGFVFQNYSYNSGVVTAKPTPTPVPPSEVTMRQARAQLIIKGKFTLVDDYIKAMTGIQGDLARNEWEYSTRVERNRELVAVLRPLLNLTNIEMDAWFIEAEKL